MCGDEANSVHNSCHTSEPRLSSQLQNRCNLGFVDIKVNQIQSHETRGIGKQKNKEVHLHIDESVTPVAQAPCRTPFHFVKQVSEELDNL